MSAQENDEEAPPPEDTFKIFVATDIHLGYAEKNPVRGQDSFVTFEEILQLAVKNEVDFLLLGGDLFHESKPSPYCVYKCLELLRKYCLGDKPVGIEFLSDQSYHFQNQRLPIVNYEDPNLNVGIPVFSIHGNHDDPTGNKQVSALDILASSGLVNYFGRFSDITKIDIRPILLQKGETKLALYGLSHVKDERLGRLFRDKKVTMKKPDGDDWFNMLVLHQNRAARGVKNFIPDTALPDFMHLVIWGHEHDCRIEPEEVGNKVFVSQPGSSVATSLAIGESTQKKVGLLHVYQQQFKLIPIELQTVRPFLYEELILEDPTSVEYCLEKPSEQAIAHVKEKINEMIAKAASRHKDKNKPPPLPLLRLKVFYHDEQQVFSGIRIGMQFSDRVANPDDIIKLNTLISKERKKRSNLNLDEDEFENFGDMNEWASCVEDVIMKYLQKEETKQSMTVLSVKGLTEAVTRAVKYADSDAVQRIFDKQLKKTCQQLTEMDPDIDKIQESIVLLRDQRLQDAAENDETIDIPDENDADDHPEVKMEAVQHDGIEAVLISSDDETPVASTSTKSRKPAAPKGRGRGNSSVPRGRGTRGKRGKNSNYSTLDSFCN